MLDESTVSTIPQHKRRPKTAAERQHAYRQRKRQQRQTAPMAVSSDVIANIRHADLNATALGARTEGPTTPDNSATASPVMASAISTTRDVGGTSATADVASVTPAVALPAAGVTPMSPVVALPATTSVTSVTPAATSPVAVSVLPVTETLRHVTSRWPIGSIGLTVAALALVGAGITMNGWFARSLGSTDLAGWLFLGIGVAADLVAFFAPSTAAQLWGARRRATAFATWLVWSMTFVFAVTAGIGFASVNIADVTLTRGSRDTPAVTTARDALRDAMTSRDRECKGGVGRICREREQAVIDSRQALVAALSALEHAADPQTDAAVKIVAWLSAGTVKPVADDFNMLRLILLALLPQIGGILLMIGRVRKEALGPRYALSA